MKMSSGWRKWRWVPTFISEHVPDIGHAFLRRIAVTVGVQEAGVGVLVQAVHAFYDWVPGWSLLGCVEMLRVAVSFL